MSFDINTVTIVGRLTRDVETAVTNNNITISKFSIANNQGKDNLGNDIVSFFNVTAWRKTAELCSQYLKKGSQVIIKGKLSQNRFTDKDGNKRSTVEIVAENVQFIGTNNNGNNGTSNQTSSGNTQGFQNDQRFGQGQNNNFSNPPDGIFGNGYQSMYGDEKGPF